MTNSTPKNNKIVRQGSPNSKKSSPRNSNYVKTVTYFANGNNTSPNKATPTNNTENAGGRNSRSSSNRQSPVSSSAKSIPRTSPVRCDSPRSSPTNDFYAGAKFSEPPSPTTLPKPPMNWTGLIMGCQSEVAKTCHISQNFRMILHA